MSAYIVRKTSFGQSIVRRADGAFIPEDPGNGDFRDYQAWLAAGNQPDEEEQDAATGERKPKKAK